MSLKNAEWEVVEYKTADIEHGIGRLIYNFAQYSGIVGTKLWIEMRLLLSPLTCFSCCASSFPRCFQIDF